jgi:hypothetical protein
VFLTSSGSSDPNHGILLLLESSTEETMPNEFTKILKKVLKDHNMNFHGILGI